MQDGRRKMQKMGIQKGRMGREKRKIGEETRQGWGGDSLKDYLRFEGGKVGAEVRAVPIWYKGMVAEVSRPMVAQKLLIVK